MEIFVETNGVIYNTLSDRWGEEVAREWLGRVDEATAPVGRAFSKYADDVLRQIWNRHRTPWNGSVKNSTDRLQRRSGKGIESIIRSRRVQEGPTMQDIAATMTTGSMSIHETGGTISARSTRYLTIPLPAAMDRRGVALKRSARDWPDTFVKRSRAGNLIIFQKRGKTIVPLYLLKSNVTIPARLRMAETVDDELPRLERAVVAALELALQQA